VPNGGHEILQSRFTACAERRSPSRGELFEHCELDSFGLKLNRLDARPQPFGTFAWRGWRSGLQAASQIAQRADDLLMPGLNDSDCFGRFGGRHRVMTNRAHPRCKQKDIYVTAMVILQAKTGIGYTRCRVETDCKGP
jgi:hypothetical protein